MRTLALMLTAAMFLGAAGCASVSTATRLNGQALTTDGMQPVAHINGKVSGIYFLPIVPILSGNIDKADGGTFTMAFGRDTCRLDETVEMVTRAAKVRGATKVTDLQSDTGSFYIPPFFWLKHVQVSGNAIK